MIIVASVSCIYGIGSVESYTSMTLELSKGLEIGRSQLLADLVALQYRRNDMGFARGDFAYAATRSTCSPHTMRIGPGALSCLAMRSTRSPNLTR